MAKEKLTEKFLQFEDKKLESVRFVHQEGGQLFTVTMQRGDKMNSLKNKGMPCERAVYVTHPPEVDPNQLSFAEAKAKAEGKKGKGKEE